RQSSLPPSWSARARAASVARARFGAEHAAERWSDALHGKRIGIGETFEHSARTECEEQLCHRSHWKGGLETGALVELCQRGRDSVDGVRVGPCVAAGEVGVTGCVHAELDYQSRPRRVFE